MLINLCNLRLNEWKYKVRSKPAADRAAFSTDKTDLELFIDVWFWPSGLRWALTAWIGSEGRDPSGEVSPKGQLRK